MFGSPLVRLKRAGGNELAFAASARGSRIPYFSYFASDRCTASV